MGSVICILIVMFCSSPLAEASVGGDSTLVMFWNLENLFDWKDDMNKDAHQDFCAEGERRWTSKRFYSKCRAIGKAVLYIGSEEGRLPDVIGVAEVENSFALRSLVKAGPLRKTDYGIVHYDSPDPRGIDVGLLYRKSVFSLERSAAIRIPDFPTRDILLVDLRQREQGGQKCRDISVPSFPSATGPLVHILVCHLPSKYGGEKESFPKRQAAVARLCEVIDSLSVCSGDPVVVMGDFNDTPSSPALVPLTEQIRAPKNILSVSPLTDNHSAAMGSPRLVNMAAGLHGEGTIRYDGRWELIDMFFVSPPLAPTAAMKIHRLPFLMTRDRAHGGEKPLRAYVGPRYAGGVSDHCPISLTITLPPPSSSSTPITSASLRGEQKKGKTKPFVCSPCKEWQISAAGFLRGEQESGK